MSDFQVKVPLRHVAHTRSGDKGNTSNITVIAYDSVFYPFIKDQLTDAALLAHYRGLIEGPVTRYAVDRLGVLNFVCDGALGGGVSRSLRLDQYGKTLAAGVLDFEIELPAHVAAKRTLGIASDA